MRKRALILVLGGLVLLMTGCDLLESILDPDDNTPAVELQVDRQILGPGDSITVTLYNRSAESLFLEGCNPIYFSWRADTGWVDTHLRVCVWEGYEIEVPAGGFYREKVGLFSEKGLVRFFTPVYRGCKFGLPISQAECSTRDIYYSKTVQIRQAMK
jgi:hypothetical protein